jgi:hypothetical protein
MEMMTVVAMNTEKARFNMIQRQIRPWDVRDPSVLALLDVVRRGISFPKSTGNWFLPTPRFR